MKNNLNVIIPKDGAILSVPDDTPTEALKKLSDQLHAIWPDRRFLMVAGEIKNVSEADMNAAGWYKRASNE
ncbi:hypothetical protein [Idiomarina sp.]|uniref:hypothetical protein n=1 Tax=Idiomarina sp. TaxID=1874361 RepID=UPI001D60CE39|nr:hypothetical protein [Idiomarina sp.]MCJ8317000.1 hypothetical protein [Idiomarina sp.]NQZ17379.1 hypothetical protein [Idiomarina sp.]